MKNYLIISVFLCLFCTTVLPAIPLELLSREETWKNEFLPPLPTRETLLESVELARKYFLNHQKDEGNFIYQIDLHSGAITEEDNQVRQAGALWGLSSLNRDFPNDTTTAAVFRGINFFTKNLKQLPNGTQCFAYPGDSSIKTGSVALFCLALIEFMRGQDATMSDAMKSDFRRLLDMHISFLQKMELDDGTWSKEYDLSRKARSAKSSPYYDGETLLAYIKAARYLGYDRLIPRINKAIPTMVHLYVSNCMDVSQDQNLTKGFFQWGCMSFNEYIEANWLQNRELAGQAALTLAWWNIYKNNLAQRQGNTGYAIEGLVSAWNIARTFGKEKEAAVLEETLNKIMGKLMSWQYKGPFMKYNQPLSALMQSVEGQEKAIGGITDSATSTTVRIDTVQHQVHAMLLMLKYIHTENAAH